MVEVKKHYYPSKFKVYMCRTSRGHLYTGISGDPRYRISEHNKGKGAKCLRGQLPVTLVWQTPNMMTKSEALRLEHFIKRKTHAEKEQMVKDGMSTSLIIDTAKNNFDGQLGV